MGEVAAAQVEAVAPVRATEAAPVPAPVARALALESAIGNRAFARLAADRPQLARFFGGCSGGTQPHPRPPAPQPPAPHTVWAEQRGGPRLPMCADPRGAGEPGWDWAVDYTTLTDLRDTLRTRARDGTVDRIAISVHGDPGALYLEGDQTRALTLARLQAVLDGRPTLVNIGETDTVYNVNVQYFRGLVDRLREIGALLSPQGLIRFPSCDVAANRDGIALLRLLAGRVIGRRVVGFGAAGVVRGEDVGGSGGQQCSYPGTREAHGNAMRIAGVQVDHAGQQLGWMDEQARTAVIVSPDGVAHHNAYAFPDQHIAPYDERPGVPTPWDAPAPPPRPLETDAERRRAIEATGGFFRGGRGGHHGRH
jgi:hypothetical protein